MVNATPTTVRDHLGITAADNPTDAVITRYILYANRILVAHGFVVTSNATDLELLESALAAHLVAQIRYRTATKSNIKEFRLGKIMVKKIGGDSSLSVTINSTWDEFLSLCEMMDTDVDNTQLIKVSDFVEDAYASEGVTNRHYGEASTGSPAQLFYRDNRGYLYCPGNVVEHPAPD